MVEKIKSIGYALFCSVIFFGVWFLDFLNSTVYLHKIILNSLFSSISLFIITLLCSFFIIKARENKNKFPYTKVTLSIVLVIILSAIILSTFIGGSAESIGFGMLFIMKHSIYTIISSLIFVSLIGYFYPRSEKILIVLLIIGLIIVSSIITFKFISNKGCLPADYICFAEQAIKDKNQDFCEKTSASVYDCYNYYNFQLVKESNGDSSICEGQTGELRDECFTHFVRISKNPEYCKSVEDECKRINCCMWTYESEEFISKEEAMKCGVVNDQIGCGNRKFISE